MIDILIPVLNRPHRVAPLLASLECTELPYTVTFLLSPGDDVEREAVEASGEDFIQTDWPAGKGDFARKTNLGFQSTCAEYVFLGADDLEFLPHWDIRAVEALEAGGFGVCGTQDGGNPQVKAGLHATHSLVRRAYIEECGGTWTDGPGVVYHEGYEHQWVDAELVAVAKERGCWVFAHGSHVIHHHPMWDRRVARDLTYAKALDQSAATRDEALFRARAAAA